MWLSKCRLSKIGAVTVVAALVLPIFCAKALAGTFEQTGHFAGSVDLPAEPGVFSEEVQLAGTGGMAVNVNGAGGVSAGTVYAATRVGEAGQKVRIAVYTPVTEGGIRKLVFSHTWEVRGTAEPYAMCGPGAPPSHVPAPTAECPARANGGSGNAWDVDIDQETGNVYVLIAGAGLPAGAMGVVEYSPDGSSEITRFGEIAALGETTAASPGKIHNSPYLGGLAVDASGNAYVFDENPSDNFYHRLMVFKPKTPGNYEEYEYAGQGKDIGAGFLGETHFPGLPVIDEKGNLYVAGETFVEEYDPEEPAKSICTVSLPKQAITAITVNPKSGEVFYFSQSKPKRIHQLAPCKEGTFAEPEPAGIEASPERDDLSALAFDPLHEFDADHDAGILYGAAPSDVPNIGGKGQPGASSLGYVFAPVAEDPPSVLSESAARISERSAELRAQINPESSQTRYAFQYLSAAAYLAEGESFAAAAEAPPGGGPLGGGAQPLPAAALVTGLSPGTEYVFRAIATSRCKEAEPELICEDVGEPKFFATYPESGLGLPDGRAYELVSPAAKFGGEVFPAEPNVNSCPEYPECKPGDTYQHFPMQASADGNAVTYEGFAFAPGTGATIENEYLARRGPAGWQSVNLTPPALESKAAKGYKLFDAPLSQSILEQPGSPLLASAPLGYPDLYLQPAAAPTALTPLLTAEPPNHRPFNRVPGTGKGSLQLALAGASADLSRVFFEANDALTEESEAAPEAIDGGEGLNNLYEWHAGALALVNVAPGNSETAPGAALGSGALAGGGTNNIPVSVYTHAISDDGSRAFWTAADGKTYVRVGGARTIEVKGPGNCKESVPLAERACFLTAAPDGRRVLLSDGRIYQLDEAGEGYDPVIDLTEGAGGFQGLVGQTDDLSRLYFVLDPAKGAEALTKGTGDLSEGSPALTDVHATSGAFAVGQTIEGPGIPAGTTIVAVGVETLELSAAATASHGDAALTAGSPLAAGEENSEGAKPRLSGSNLYSWQNGSLAFLATLLPSEESGDAQSWEVVPALRMGEASPDGGFLAFLSRAPLTGYDNKGRKEVFVYDAAAAKLTCASCNPTGSAPLGNSILRLILNVKGSLPQPRYLTDEGRLFFDSADSLVAADTNHGVEDVYQYEPGGVGACQREAGCVSLISAGREGVDSNFVTMDPAGNNAFFTARDRLVPADTDQLMDLYDARVGGGFASESQLAPLPCQGEPCQGPSPPAPLGPPPGSQSFEGPGNPKPKKQHCKKGQVQKHGKCVKKKHAKKGKGRKRRAGAHRRGGAR